MLALLIRVAHRWQPNIGWLAAGLLIAALWTVPMGVMEAEWIDGDILFLYVTLVGSFVAAVLATAGVPGRWATPILALSGLVYVGQVVAHILPSLVGAAQELWAGLNWLALRVAGAETLPPSFPLWHESGARLATLGERLASWAVALVGGEPVRNPVAFLSVSGMLLWVCSSWAVWWTLRRGRPLLAMLPLGAVLSMSTYLSSGPVGWVIVFVALVTLLLPVVHVTTQEQRWNREGIDYSNEIRFDVWQVAFVVMLLIVLLSLVTPSFSIPRLVWSFWELISRPQAVIQDLLIRFFGGVEPETPPSLPAPSGPAGGGPAVDAALPNAHLLGGNPDLSRQRVMYVCIDAPPPIVEDFVPDEEAFVGPKYYWRGVTYDTFGGWYWGNGRSSAREVPAYEPVLTSVVSETQPLRQRYLIEVSHGRTLYAVGEPRTVDQPVTSRTRAPGDLVGLEGTISDYVVQSAVSQATVKQLREASTAYPAYIVERYLALYDELPARVRSLAAEITQDAAGPYEKAIAIERYLRQFEYDLEAPAPPPEQDVVEFFLFDVQRGYCDYYASSFVVLARAAGVPARLAVGYAMGGYNTDRGCYAVTERDGHSWPEVYFTGYGWIPFEPTASFSVFERPEGEAPVSLPAPLVPSLPRRPWTLALRAWWRGAREHWATNTLIVLVFVLFLLLIVQEYRRWRHSRLTPGEVIAECYHGMLRLGARLGVARRPYDTPAEYGVLLSAAIRARVARWSWRGRKLPLMAREAAGRVQALSRAYERASYGAHSLVEAHQVQAEREWELLQAELRWLRVNSAEREA